MKIGLRLPNFARWFRGDAIWATCEKGKELDLDVLSFVDHVIFTPQQYVGYGNGYMDIWTAMSYVAAVTNVQGWRPILSQSICVIPYRPPIQQAKIAATVDSLSGGRLLIGAGSGYNENEFAALGLNVRERGEMTHEYLACMKELWTHPVASFHGKYANFDEMTISVRPTQQPHPPILYGSSGPMPFRRIAERYQGWLRGTVAVKDANADYFKALDQDWAKINTLWKANGRQGKPYLMVQMGGQFTTDREQAGGSVVKGLATEQAIVGTEGRIEAGGERAYVSTFPISHVSEVVKQLRSYEELGVDMVLINVPSYRFGTLDNLGMQLQQMDLLAEHVLPKITRDKKPIEMDYDGKRFTPMG
ncbi:MAG: LLM class flavin-dependent oxidoreductase [Dehalococcoidia bacterium]|nr:LLM class flavin-dependent oxidoreductase [Dehalococcoidia bacterium]